MNRDKRSQTFQLGFGWAESKYNETGESGDQPF